MADGRGPGRHLAREAARRSLTPKTPPQMFWLPMVVEVYTADEEGLPMRSDVVFAIAGFLAVELHPPALAAGGRPTPASPHPPTSGWVKRVTTSKMDDSRTVVLSRAATTTIHGWPNQTTLPRLILRCEESEIEAYIVTGLRPNVETGNTEGATILLRLDKEPPFEQDTSQSTDGEALFIPEPKVAIVKFASHQSLRFRFTPFNSAPQETSFDLRSLAAVLKPLQDACHWDPERDAREAATEAASAAEANARAAEAKEKAEHEAADRAQREAAEQRAREQAAAEVRWHADQEWRAQQEVQRLATIHKRLLRLTDDSAEVRLDAVRMLGKLRAREALSTLRDLAQRDPDAQVREAAGEALAIIEKD